MKIKAKYFILMLSALTSVTSAYAAPTLPILINGLPLEFKHPTVPGQGVTKHIDMRQLGFIDAPWTVTCQYQTHETGNGTLPITVLGEGDYSGNYQSQLYVDGQYAGPADVLYHPVQALLTKESGVITFTGVYDYKYYDPGNSGPPSIVLTNVDGTGDFTITSCSAEQA